MRERESLGFNNGINKMAAGIVKSGIGVSFKITVKDSNFQPGAISCKHELVRLESKLIP